MGRRANTDNGDGWYVVLDHQQNVTYASKYKNNAQRHAIETEVAERLVPGTWYGQGPTMREALHEAMTRYARFTNPQKEVVDDAGTQTEEG